MPTSPHCCCNPSATVAGLLSPGPSVQQVMEGTHLYHVVLGLAAGSGPAVGLRTLQTPLRQRLLFLVAFGVLQGELGRSAGVKEEDDALLSIPQHSC